MEREVVIEIERVQLVRNRARTQVRYCPDCGAETDFVSLIEAGALFMVDTDPMTSFIAVNPCHFQTRADGDVCICLIALLETMRTKSIGSRIELLGDTAEE
jgi:hypothetical protein